ncbi:MAG: deoxyribose-phosphate aldolase [Candidatus Gastranaerophilales bacterium]|nr:deoxyribose-phosphate aldolase [Candidatus Gastranaerophilales bacterium]
MKDLNKYIEHTLLKPEATKEELVKLFDEAVKHKFLGVCINPCNVKFAKEYLKNEHIKIVTVAGFPLGASLNEVKALEAKTAIKNGADEVDMVINVGFLKNKKYDEVRKDIAAVKAACENTVLKVIIETDLLTKEEIVKACLLCTEAKADFVKTSTGFVKNGVGARVEDIELMYKTVSPYGLRVKASAGIRDREKAIEMINAGASRLGTSSGVEIVKQ